jgi:hypothetical protein
MIDGAGATLERFTPRARSVLVAADASARARNSDHVGGEHLLLGLYAEPEGLAARTLLAMEVPKASVEAALTGSAAGADDGPVKQTPASDAGTTGEAGRYGRRVRAAALCARRRDGPAGFRRRGAGARAQLHRHRAHPARSPAGPRCPGRAAPRSARRQPGGSQSPHRRDAARAHPRRLASAPFGARCPWWNPREPPPMAVLDAGSFMGGRLLSPA